MLRSKTARLGMSWMAAMLRNVVVVCHRWVHAPKIHAASHFYHEKRVAWVSISMHACDPFSIVMGLRWAAGALLHIDLQNLWLTKLFKHINNIYL